MKKLIALALGTFLTLSPAYAGDPFWEESNPANGYVVAQSTISVSSFSATTIEAFNRYQQVTLMGDLGTSTSIHYRIDGVTSNIASVGQSFSSGTQKTITTSQAISLLLSPGVAAVVIRVLKIQK